MGFEFRPAVRENASTLIALAGPSGGGKTYGALRLARGLVGAAGKIAFIDTEAKRATHYSDKFAFDHGDMKPPFSPAAFREAIETADRAGYGAIVIDSMSHEHAGDGGVLEMAEAELQRMAGDDWGKREKMKMASWIKPKGEHKRMMSRLLQLRAHLIFCLRAEEKVKPMVGPDGKTKIVPIGWVPICDKNFMYEMTASFLLADTVNHLPTPIKLQEQHRGVFLPDRPIDEAAGEALAAWARGGTAAAAAAPGKISARQWLADRNAELAAGFSTLEQARAWLSEHNPVLEKVRAKAPEEAMALAGRYHELARPLEMAAMATGEAA